LNLDFGFCKLRVNNKDLTYNFSGGLCNQLNTANFEGQLRKSDRETADFWKANAWQKFNKTE
jgi:hypothetical protein